jgi:hypothetical protein
VVLSGLAGFLPYYKYMLLIIYINLFLNIIF